jgi:hypothetical protein
MTENRSCTSRRSFLSRAAGSLLATFLPKEQLLIGDDMPTSSCAYRGQKTANTHLMWDVFVTPSIPVVTTDFAPGEHERPWPPISSTLIYGLRDAVVVLFGNDRQRVNLNPLCCRQRRQSRNAELRISHQRWEICYFGFGAIS